MKEFLAEVLQGEEYRRNLVKRLKEGTAGVMEPLVWAYLYGKPKDTVKVEGEGRPPVVIALMNQDDPLAEPEPARGAKRPPAPPSAPMPEVSFDMEDLELAPPGREAP